MSEPPTLLIVDDNRPSREYLSALFRAHGFRVEVAGQGEEAWELIGRARPSMVISDLLMPVMDGFTLLRRVRRDPALDDLLFVVYTATYTEPADEELVVRMGADAFLVKPTEPEPMMESIQRVLREGPQGRKDRLREAGADDLPMPSAYGAALLRKLDQRNQQLEEANRELKAQADKLRSEHEARRESEERYRRLFRNRHAVMLIIDPENGAIVDANPAAEAFYGWPADRLRSMRMQDINTLPPESVLQEMQKARRLLRPFFEFSHRRADGSIRQVEVYSGPIMQGGRELLYSIVHDVTDRHALEARLLLLGRMTESIPHPMAYANREEVLEAANPAYARLFSCAPEGILGKHLSTLFPQDFYETEIRPNFQRCLKGEPTHFETRSSYPGMGVRWMMRSYIPCPDQAGTVVGVILHNVDVTERRLAELQAIRVQRMESIGTLAGGIAHDLNNILTPIIMGADFLYSQTPEPRLREVLETIRSSARRGSAMVSQVLSFARGVEGKRSVVDVHRLLAEAKAMAVEIFPKAIQVGAEFPTDRLFLEADTTQLHQVLLNLMVNARDAMPAGGSLTLRALTEEVRQPGASLPVLDLPAGPYVVLEVSDTGEGIPEDRQERIFEPFFTTKAEGQGTGLGLSTSLGIVRSHGGTITVQSRSGAGATFRVFLPRGKDPESHPGVLDRDPLSTTSAPTQP